MQYPLKSNGPFQPKFAGTRIPLAGDEMSVIRNVRLSINYTQSFYKLYASRRIICPDYFDRLERVSLYPSINREIFSKRLYFNCFLDESERKELQDELEQLESQARTIQNKLSYNSTTDHLYEIYHTPTCSSRKLAFQVEHFFATGSPLAVFVSLRNLDEYIDSTHKSCQSLFPYEICKRFYNIFHPADPLTYRMEPIISGIYSQVKPLTIESASSKPSEEAIRLAMGPYLPKIPEYSTGNPYKIKQVSLNTIEREICLENDNSVTNHEKLTERLDFALKEGDDFSHINFLTAHSGDQKTPFYSYYYRYSVLYQNLFFD